GTAGAGDAFTSTLGAALAEGLPAADAMLEASANAASVVSAVDTTTGLLTREALDTRLAALAPEPPLTF
ncbi:MAG: carbohydrate kinase family protein, partial [Pseudomonadota bacterium]